jgi:hypothetical protein
MKTILIVSLLFKVSLCLVQSKQLSPGDIAITAFNFRDPDEFSFITFTDLPAGTVIHFTDCGWKNDNSFRTSEGILTYTVPSEGKQAFEVITYNNDPGFNEEGVSGFFGFSADGDQIIAYQGDFTTPSFIFALNNNGSDWQTDATDTHSSSLPTGLTTGLTAVALPELQNQSYNCIMESGDQNTLLQAISDPSNWDASSNRFELPTSCFQGSLPVVLHSFSVQSNPNPLICCQLSSDNLFQLDLQWSEDGKIFTTVYSTVLNNSLEEKICYEDFNHQTGYYRARILTSSEIIYSKVKHFNIEKEEILSIQLFTIEGVLVYEGKDAEEAKKNIKIYGSNKVLIKRTITSSGIEVEKILSRYYN